MKYKIIIQNEEGDEIYQQTVEDLSIKSVIDAVNPSYKVQRRQRSDAGKKRKSEESEEESPLDSLV